MAIRFHSQQRRGAESLGDRGDEIGSFRGRGLFGVVILIAIAARKNNFASFGDGYREALDPFLDSIVLQKGMECFVVRAGVVCAKQC